MSTPPAAADGYPAWPAIIGNLSVADVPGGTGQYGNVFAKVFSGAVPALPGVNVNSFNGVDPTGGQPSDAAIAAAASSLGGQSGVLMFGGTYLLNGLLAGNGGNGINLAGIPDAQQLVLMCAPGTVFKYLGSADAIRMSSVATSNRSKGSGIIGFPVIDGTSAGAGASGLHFGDIGGAQVDVVCNNFTSAGAHLDNTIAFTEQGIFRIRTRTCANAVVLDVSDGPAGQKSSTGSFARMHLDVFIENIPNTGGNGVVIQNGATLYNGRLYIGGNVKSIASGPIPVVLTVTGSVPAGHTGAGSKLYSSRFDVGVETTTNTVTAQTIQFGSSVNMIRDTYGILAFENFGGSGPFFAPSNLAASGALFRHWGPVIGDSSLPETEYGGTTVGGAIITGGTIPVTPGTTVSVNPAGAVTGMILPAGIQDGTRVYIENLSANLVTFAASGTSRVAAGASATVPAFGTRMFIWNASAALWIGGV